MLFGGKKNDADDEAMKKMGEQMQKLSEQIGKLQQQLAEKTAEADRLRTQAAKNVGNDAALKDAQAQMDSLRNQLKDLQSKTQQQAAGASAAAKSAPPAGHSVGSAATSAPSAPAAAAAGALAAGVTAFVTRAGGLPLRLRSGPSLDQEILDRLQPGSSLTVLEGPHQADGHAWWRIRTPSGGEGWVAGENLVTQPD